MKILKGNYWFSAIILVVIIFNYVLANQLEKTTPESAYKMQNEKNAIIVDVREQNEQKDGRVKNALSLPMSVMDNNKVEFEKMILALPKDKNIIVYCRSGRRSGLVGSELEKRGLKVLNLGGFDSWKTQGLPIE